MPLVTPSAVVDAIDSMFGPSRNPLDMHLVQATKRDEVQTLLRLIEEIPRELLQLNAQEYLRFNRCYASLAAALSVWSVAGAGPPARQVEGNDPVALLRALLKTCPDALPPPIELEFIDDLVVRSWLLERGTAAWTDFGAGDWLGASVMAGATLEGLLLWALTDPGGTGASKRLEKLGLSELVARAFREGFIDEEEKCQALQAADVRNLVHLGRQQRNAKAISRGHALGALAAVDLVTAALIRRSSSSGQVAG